MRGRPITQASCPLEIGEKEARCLEDLQDTQIGLKEKASGGRHASFAQTRAHSEDGSVDPSGNNAAHEFCEAGPLRRALDWSTYPPSVLFAKCAAGTERMEIKVITPADMNLFPLVIPSQTVLTRDRWYLPAQIASQLGELLIDTGATTTLPTKRFYDGLCHKPPLVPTQVVVKVADGGTVRTEGMTICPMKIGGRLYKMPCLIVSGISGEEDGILGADFYHVHRCNLDWSGRLTLEDGAVSVACRAKGAVAAARAQNDVYIRAHSVALCAIDARGLVPTSYLFEPYFASLGETTVGSLCTYGDTTEETAVPIYNPTAMPVIIPKDTVLGDLHEAELTDDSVMFPDIPEVEDGRCPL